MCAITGLGVKSRSLSTSDLAQLANGAPDAVVQLETAGAQLQPGLRRQSDSAPYDSISHPIKRTRSEQSLLTAGALAGDGGAAAVSAPPPLPLPLRPWPRPMLCDDGSDVEGPDAAAAAAIAAAAAAVRGGGGGRGGWCASLPVVMSDYGSSTNSLGSLDSDLTRPLSAAAPPHGAAPATPPHGKPGGGGGGGVTYIQAVGSAASLQHAALGRAVELSPVAASLIYRGGGAGAERPGPAAPGAAAAPRFAPPPLISPAHAAGAAPGQDCAAALATTAAAAFGVRGGRGRAGAPGGALGGRPMQQQQQQQQQQQEEEAEGEKRLLPSASLPSLPPCIPETEGWDFDRRQRAVRSAAPSSRGGSGSSSFGRRRSSIEASLPWRARLDSAIAAVESVAADEPLVPRRGSAADLLPPASASAAAAAAAAAAKPAAGPPPRPPSYDAAEAARRRSGAAAAAAAAAAVAEPAAEPAAEPVQGRSSTESDGDGDGGAAAPPAAAERGAGGRTSSSSSRSVSPGSGRVGRVRRNSAMNPPGYYSRPELGGNAAFELFLRLNRARQTYDFAKRQAQEFAELDCGELTVWEALDALNSLREYEAGLVPASEGLEPGMPLKEHALQVAELCRLAFPDKEWLHLVGLLHGLGKLLAHPDFGSQPQWAVAGETYPLGCRFAPQVGHHELFSANPDRRRRAFASANGVYSPGCGLKEVYMSWGAPEYLYLVMVLNQVALPEEALFVLRYQKFYSLTRPGGAYGELLSPEDGAAVPLLAAFQRLAVYRRVELPDAALRGRELYDYYDGLIAKYVGHDKLFW
ncbi:inositol oxygenase-like [Raphidocelis subcapitata]|uniref:Inositol oxygenase n=1 Tax=Raphidocelis subcapitata TaxID=307507 RepID=A0A2V0PBA3_9CHLO|nr:inositol oxygenase-like [Raphidocelis subcapitata]|eukprot:GBF97144.1 inositol oxygenase-like [Raphidocelis subcapitata]